MPEWSLFVTAQTWINRGHMDLATNIIKFLILEKYGGIYINDAAYKIIDITKLEKSLS